MNIAVYCGSTPGTCEKFTDVATQLGKWIASRGYGLVYGGSSVGLMGVVSRTCMDFGAPVIGVEPQFFIDEGVQQHDLTELVVVETMSQRKAKMIELADAFVALPGGVGTLEEISEIMSRIRLDLTNAPCVLLNIEGFYDSLHAFLNTMSQQGFILPNERDSFVFAESIGEMARAIDGHAGHSTSFESSTLLM